MYLITHILRSSHAHYVYVVWKTQIVAYVANMFSLEINVQCFTSHADSNEDTATSNSS